jgi:hypothetical protein
MLSVFRRHGIDGMVINEYRSVGGMRIGRENRFIQRKPVAVPLFPLYISREPT